MNFTTLLALPLLLPTLTPALTAQQAVIFPAKLTAPRITDAQPVCPFAPNGLRYYGPAC